MGLVSWLIAIPFLTAVAVVLTPARQWRMIRWISAFGTGLHLVLTGVMTWRYWQVASLDVASMKTALTTKLYLVERIPWFQSMGIQYFVGVDGISVAMVILTSIIIFSGVLAGWSVETRTKEFFALLLTLVTGVFGVFLSFDLFLFFMFYELAVLPMYLLIGIWGTGPKEYSAMKLTLMLLIGSAFVLVGFLALYHVSGLHTFDLQQLAKAQFAGAFQKWVFPMIFVGFGVIGEQRTRFDDSASGIERRESPEGDYRGQAIRVQSFVDQAAWAPHAHGTIRLQHRERLRVDGPGADGCRGFQQKEYDANLRRRRHA